MKGRLEGGILSATLHGATRVQNLWQWEQYLFHKQKIALKIKGTRNEMELYHGTRGTPPYVLCQGEKGVDIHYSKKGLWGSANYFTNNAAYANKYAHMCMTTNEKQLLVMKVTLGVVYDYGTRTNQELKMPPPLPNSINDLNLLSPTYDNISGITSNTRVIYDL